MKNKVLEKAKKIISERKFYAEQEALSYKTKALENSDFKKNYNDYISLIIDNAKQGLGETPQSLAKKVEYKQILKTELAEFDIPVMYNFNFGHSYPRTIIPYGTEAVLDPINKTFTIIESSLN